jgi:hydroxyacylglutathione hydrolase
MMYFSVDMALGSLEKGLVGALLLERITAGPWQTNTYVLAKSPNQSCVVIDPGFESVKPLADVFNRFGLEPAGIVLTHGHLDHVASVPDISEKYSIPVWVHPEDEILLSEPAAGLSPDSVPLLEQFYGTKSPSFRPTTLHLYQDGDTIDVAGFQLKVLHSPGHTPGCSVLSFADGETKVMISGDVLFNNGIGRTDLPRSSAPDMARSLARLMASFTDEVVVYPGHGPETTIGKERHESPFLREAMRP